MFSVALEEHVKRNIYLYTFLFSLMSSFILISSRTIINTDGVVYLASSEAFLTNGAQAASAIEANILLPVMIASLSKFTNLSFALSADIINTLLHSFLLLAYVYLIKQLGGNRTVQLIAAVILLLNPSLIGYRESIFRDPGYWSFSVLSLGLLLQYEKKEDNLSVLFWVLSLCGAVLFRPEALVLSLSPLAFLFSSAEPFKEKLIKTGKVYLLLLLLLVLVIFLLKIFNLNNLYQGGVQHLLRYLDPNKVELVSYQEMSSRFAGLFNYPYPSDYVWLGFGLSLVPIFITSVSGAISWPMLLAFIYCFYKKTLVFPRSFVYRSYIVLALAVLLLFLFMNYFITARYSTLLGLLLLVALPFSLYKTYAGKWHAPKVKVFTAGLLIVLCIDSFISFGYSREYLLEGIDWVHNNTPPDSRIMSNEKKITYSIARDKDFNDSEIVFNAWEKSKVEGVLDQYDYFLEDTFWNKEELMKDHYPEAQEVARFTSERGNRLVIYKLP